MKEESKTRPWAALAVAVMFVLASLVSAAPARAAEERTVIPMGRAVGIKLFSDGVMVVGFSEVAGAEGSSAPARDCGLREGDIITHINREEVDSIEEVQSVLQEVGGKPMSIRAVRDDKTVQLTAQAVQCGSDGQYKLGAWIRDSMAGIGTLTFCEPATGRFGALGHHDRQRPEGEVQNRRLPFPVIAVSCVSSDHLEAVSPRCDRRINFCKILIKVHAEEAVLRLPLVQAIVFRILCHAYYPLCRENKPRTRRTPGRGGFILLNSL